MEIIVKSFPEDEVLGDNYLNLYDPERQFNTTNHFEGDEVPPDYKEWVSQTSTHHWIDAFHTFYSVINIEARDVRWMVEAARVGQCTGGVRSRYLLLFCWRKILSSSSTFGPFSIAFAIQHSPNCERTSVLFLVSCANCNEQVVLMGQKHL